MTADLPALRPFLNDAGRFFTAFKPGAKALGETSPTINAALRAGIPALNRSPRLYRQLTPTAEALLDFQARAGRLQRPRPADRHERSAGALDQVHRPGADDLPVPDADLPAARQRLRAGQRRRKLAQRDLLRGAQRPERRVGPRVRAGERPEPEEPPPLQPLSQNRARTASAKRATSATRRARRSSDTPPNSGARARGTKNSGTPARERHQGRGDGRPHQVAAQQRGDRDHLHPRLHGRPLPGVHQTRPLHRLRLHAQRHLLQRCEHLDQLAGADRRRRRRQSDLGLPRRQQHQGHLHRRRQGPADPRRRLRRDQTAHLPRGELLRRPQTGQPERAGIRQRRDDPGQPHLDRDPARPDPHRSAIAGARRPQPPAGELRGSADAQADAPPKTRPSCPR